MMRRVKKTWVLSGLAAILVIVLSFAGYQALAERRLRAGLEGAEREMRAGNSPGARDQLMSLAARWPGRAEVLFPLGESELACGRIEQAITAWSQIPPGSPLAAAGCSQQSANRAAWWAVRRCRKNPERRARGVGLELERALASSTRHPLAGGCD